MSDWQLLEDAAYSMDGEPSVETDWLKSIFLSFSNSNPQDDFNSYAVQHLAGSLLRNRKVDLEALKREGHTDEHFGVCPKCGMRDSQQIVGRGHF